MNPSPWNNRKKMRVDKATAEKPTDKRNPIAPLRAAEDKIIGSFSTLQSTFAEHLQDNAKKHILLLSKIHNKNLQIRKMQATTEDKKFFPRSTRFEFQLNISKEGTEDPEFITLK